MIESPGTSAAATFAPATGTVTGGAAQMGFAVATTVTVVVQVDVFPFTSFTVQVMVETPWLNIPLALAIRTGAAGGPGNFIGCTQDHTIITPCINAGTVYVYSEPCRRFVQADKQVLVA